MAEATMDSPSTKHDMIDDSAVSVETIGGRRRHKKRKSHRKRHRGGSSCVSPEPYDPLNITDTAYVGGKRRRRKSKKHRRKSTRKGMCRKTARRSHKR